MMAGVAISPDTPSTVITDEIGAAADMLLVMTVYPGIYSLHANRMSLMTRIQEEAARNFWSVAYQKSQSFVRDFLTKT